MNPRFLAFWFLHPKLLTYPKDPGKVHAADNHRHIWLTFAISDCFLSRLNNWLNESEFFFPNSNQIKWYEIIFTTRILFQFSLRMVCLHMRMAIVLHCYNDMPSFSFQITNLFPHKSCSRLHCVRGRISFTLPFTEIGQKISLNAINCHCFWIWAPSLFRICNAKPPNGVLERLLT